MFKLDNDAGSLVDLTAYITSVSMSDSFGVIDVTTMGKNWREKIRGIADASLSVEGVYDPLPGTLIPKAGTITSTTSFELYPQGTAAGKPKITGECYVESYDMPSGIDDAVMWSASLQTSGTITFGTA